MQSFSDQVFLVGGPTLRYQPGGSVTAFHGIYWHESPQQVINKSYHKWKNNAATAHRSAK